MATVKWDQCPDATHYRDYGGMYKWYRERNGFFSFLDECGDWAASSVDPEALRKSLVAKSKNPIAMAWVKCADQLPAVPDDREACEFCVLIYQPCLGQGVGIGFYEPAVGKWYDSQGENLDGDVTHWMLKPADPKP